MKVTTDFFNWQDEILGKNVDILLVVKKNEVFEFDQTLRKYTDKFIGTKLTCMIHNPEKRNAL